MKYIKYCSIITATILLFVALYILTTSNTAIAPSGAENSIFTNTNEAPPIIIAEFPQPNEIIASPLLIKGVARGYWFFEASFPVRLLDGNSNEIFSSYIMTASDWMTEDYVPFEKEFEFDTPGTATGTLILHKDNPSGLPEHDDEVRIPIKFKI